jgi:hypothetical protein
MAMEFNATFNNISVIPWRSNLLVEETGTPEKKPTDLSQVTDKLYNINELCCLTYILCVANIICRFNRLKIISRESIELLINMHNLV